LPDCEVPALFHSHQWILSVGIVMVQPSPAVCFNGILKCLALFLSDCEVPALFPFTSVVTIGAFSRIRIG
jgi:hypothetical protein